MARDLIGINLTARILGKLTVGCTRKLKKNHKCRNCVASSR
jgi:hypothetical protein